jgi:type II secretory pathway pseudopilin PulG
MIPACQRRGITLTEILIGILILGVGMVSIMTLFPLGLLNIRAANRYSRTGFLVNSANSELRARNLLSKASFLNPLAAPWYSSATNPWYPAAAGTPRTYDPWVQDTPRFKADPWSGGFGVYRGDGPPSSAPFNNPIGTLDGPGLPVAYDPLWRYQTGVYMHGTEEARFASGLGFVRPDPNAGSFSSDASAHGLQRLTNFNPFAASTATQPMSSAVPEIFVSPEDMVMQSATDAAKGANPASPLVPDLTMGRNAATGCPAVVNDWKYTWMFTGRQAHYLSGVNYIGDIVIFENRPFAIQLAADAFAANGGNPYFASAVAPTSVVAGETVVEAVFGFSHTVTPATPGGSLGYGVAGKNAVLLRWSDKMPDPEIRVDNWIADVTYERVAMEGFKRETLDPVIGGAAAPSTQYYPYQRCYWYRIARRTQAGPGRTFPGDPPGVTYREMTVWTVGDLRAFTLLAADGSPYHVNAAFVSPYVVNVYGRSFEAVSR